MQRYGKLLVGSVFGPSDRNRHWYRLQLDFIKKYTADFDHMVYLDRTDPGLFNNSKIVGVSSSIYDAPMSGSLAHSQGLNALLEYARTERHSYLLLIDSDSFPVVPNWLDLLLGSMGRHEVAAVVRAENLDTFAHPCVHLIKRSGLDKLIFGCFPHKNLLGTVVEDCRSNVLDFFPLIRTNVINLHPILFGLYGNCFYHHGAGSRKCLFRAFECGYFKYGNEEFWEANAFEMLKEDPLRFINILFGRHEAREAR